MAKASAWKEFYWTDSSDYREMEAAWRSHWRGYPRRHMLFSPPSLMFTDCTLRELRQIIRLSFVRGKLPDYVTMTDENVAELREEIERDEEDTRRKLGRDPWSKS